MDEDYPIDLLLERVEKLEKIVERLEGLIKDHENWSSQHDHPHEHDQSPFIQGMSEIVRLS